MGDVVQDDGHVRQSAGDLIVMLVDALVRWMEKVGCDDEAGGGARLLGVAGQFDGQLRTGRPGAGDDRLALGLFHRNLHQVLAFLGAEIVELAGGATRNQSIHVVDHVADQRSERIPV